MKYAIVLAAMAMAGVTLAGRAQTAKAPANKNTDRKMEATKMKVDIWSDMVCPFCYIGKRHYEAALARFAHAQDVELEWHSYQLNPDMPKHPAKKESAHEYLARVKGISMAQSVKMHEHVTAMARQAGLTYNFDKAVVANSFNAHRLLQMAKKHGLGDKAEEAVFHAYFTAGRNISDDETLVAIGSEIGLDAVEVRKMLAGSAYTAEVNADVNAAAKTGINGVPFFIFNRQYAVSGAQPVDTFVATLERSYAEWKSSAGK